MDEDIVIPIAFFITTIILGLGIPLVRGVLKKWERAGDASRPLPHSDVRLERIEQAIEAMSVEVERLAEGQRFVAKILSERPAEAIALPRSAPEQPRHSVRGE